jgi:hypothetical protein
MEERRSAAVLVAMAIAAALLGCLASAALAGPIPEGADAGSSPAFVGHSATQNPIFTALPPRHPFMAPNEMSELHVDAFQTDTNAGPGPLGRGLQRVSSFHGADCASVTFDSRGRIVTICVGLNGPSAGNAGLFMLDPHTLEPLARMDLPPRQLSVGSNPFTDFSSGGYFYLDNQDRAVIPTTTRHLLVVGEAAGGKPGFVQQHDYDMTGAVPSGDKIISALPDWSGRIWFASTKGVVGTVDPANGAVRFVDTKEPIGNSFAVDETGGVYIVSDAALYRFTAGGDGTPQVSWRSTYPNDGKAKPGQTELGSGTTPTVTTNGLVGITDNADPIDIVVFRRDTGAQVCSAPVFRAGASDTDQSLIAVGDSFIAENNYGYSGPAATEESRSTTGGLDRVDVVGNTCQKAWHSDEVAPSVVPKASLANGLVYTYTHPPGDQSDPWYLTALDFRTGATVYKFRAGSGLGFNNNYAPVTIGPDGTAYVGVLGGIVLVRDATPPPGAAQPQPASGGSTGQGTSSAKPRLRLGVRRRCAAKRVRLAVGGRDRGKVRRVTFRVAHRKATDRRKPFARTFHIHVRHSRRASAAVTLRDGRHVKLRAKVRGCG